jgi:hypothetical protein
LKSPFEALARSRAASYETSMDASDWENVNTVVEAVTKADGGLSEPRRVGDVIGAIIAGGRAAHVMSPSAALFEAGGRLVLDEGTKTLVRTAAQRGAEHAFGYAGGPLLGPATITRLPGMLTTAVDVASTAGPLAVRAAAKEVLKGAGRASGFGFAIDGAIASVEALVAVRDGTMDRRGAALHAAREAATGAASTGAGVLLGAAVVALTGRVAAPVVFAVAAFGASGAKRLLRRLKTPTPRGRFQAPRPWSSRRTRRTHAVQAERLHVSSGSPNSSHGCDERDPS